jgi:hypothetical protein
MMQSAGILFQLTLGDFRERTRRYSFLITLLGTLFFGFLVITGKWALRLGEYRGEYNSAWVGSLMGSASTIMLGLIGFYLIKNSLSRDRRTRVGEILAATPLSNRLYIASKFISNYAVLILMAAALAAAAVLMQLTSALEGGFKLWALLAPFLFICLPVLTLVAAAGVLFESVRPLRGTFGNILYFMGAEAIIVSSLTLNMPLLDFSGLALFMPSMREAALAAYPNAELGFEMGFVGLVPGTSHATMHLFHWSGIDWSPGMVPLRLLWMGVAIGLAGLAAVFFDRFDPARVKQVKAGKRADNRLPEAESTDAKKTSSISWSELEPVTYHFSFLRMWQSEIKLMVKGSHWSWYVLALGLLVAQLTVPYEYARTYALPIAWIWPLAMWSSMGTREARFNTGQLVFSSPYPLKRQLPAMWAAGLTIAVLTGSGMILRAFLAGEVEHLVALLVGAFFIANLALFLGIVSGTKKLFEVTYLIIWYVGAINHLPQLDFLGAASTAITSSVSQAYFGISVLLLIGAIVFRRRQHS